MTIYCSAYNVPSIYNTWNAKTLSYNGYIYRFEQRDNKCLSHRSEDGYAWETLTSAVPFFNECDAIVYNGLIWFFRGYGLSYTVVNKVYTTLNGINFTEVAAPPYNFLADFRLCIHKNRLYISGGHGLYSAGVSPEFFSAGVASTETGLNWTYHHDTSDTTEFTKRGYHAFYSNGSELFIYGGLGGNGFNDVNNLSDFWISYDDGYNWVSATPPSMSLSATTKFNCIKIGNDVYSSGGDITGLGTSYGLRKTLDYYNWSSEPISATNYASSLYYGEVVWHNNRLFWIT
jgi:hypothetical protein